MNNIKISEMTEATSLNDNDLLTIVQGGLNKKITKQNAIGDIVTALNNPTKTTTEGESLSINNTRVGNIDWQFYGNTTQKTTTGINWLPMPTTTSSSTSNGITFSYEGNGIYKAKGKLTNAQNTAYSFSIPEVTIPAGNYYWHLRNIGTTTGQMTFALLYSGASKVYTAPSVNNRIVGLSLHDALTINQTQLYIGSGFGTTDNLDITFQVSIEKSDSVTEWEPFSGGAAAPNPSHPQPVNVVTGENTIEILGKNWLNIKNYTGYTNNGLSYTIQDGIITITGTAGSQGNSTMALTSLVDFETINKIPLGTYITFSVLDIEGVAASQIFMGSPRKPVLATTKCKYKKSFSNEKH